MEGEEEEVPKEIGTLVAAERLGACASELEEAAWKLACKRDVKSQLYGGLALAAAGYMKRAAMTEADRWWEDFTRKAEKELEAYLAASGYGLDAPPK